MAVKRLYMIGLYAMLLLLACKKDTPSDPDSTPEPNPGDPEEVIKPQTDPELASTIGFFMEHWQPKTFTAPASSSNTTPPASAAAVVNVDRSVVISKVPRSEERRVGKEGKV